MAEDDEAIIDAAAADGPGGGAHGIGELRDSAKASGFGTDRWTSCPRRVEQSADTLLPRRVAIGALSFCSVLAANTSLFPVSGVALGQSLVHRGC